MAPAKILIPLPSQEIPLVTPSNIPPRGTTVNQCEGSQGINQKGLVIPLRARDLIFHMLTENSSSQSLQKDLVWIRTAFADGTKVEM